MIEREYKYDVAFSLLEKDLAIANKIISILNKEVKIFLYTEKQKEMVSEDGITFFHNIFEIDSRIVVIIHRTEWGQTRWTRVEEDALKNRYLKEGPDFITLIPLDNPSEIPKWIPEAKIWHNYERFGANGAAAVIEERITKRGKELTVETYEDNIMRLRDELKTKNEISAILNGHDGKGIDMANGEFNTLALKLEEKTNNFNFNDETLKFTFERKNNHLIIKVSSYLLILEWWPQARNSLTDAYLQASIKERIFNRELFESKYANKKQDKYFFNIDINWINGWTHKGNDEFYTSDNLIDKWLRTLLELLEKDIKDIKTYNK